MVTEKRSSTNGGLVSKLVGAGKNLAKASLVAGALLMPYTGSNDKANAETIRITNYAPENSLTIGDSQASLQYHPLASDGYDPKTEDHEGDKELSTYLANPTNKNFVVYFPLDNNGTAFNAETNFINHMQVGDTYKAYLALSDDGSGIFGVPNKISFDNLDLSDNPNGVTDLAYSLKVDTLGGNNYDYDFTHTEEGLVSNTTETASWNQYVAPGFSFEDNKAHYGELTLTAIGVPEPTTTALLIGASLAGAGLGIASKKRK